MQFNINTFFNQYTEYYVANIPDKMIEITKTPYMNLIEREVDICNTFSEFIIEFEKKYGYNTKFYSAVILTEQDKKSMLNHYLYSYQTILKFCEENDKHI